jgi:fructokinase
MLEARNGHVVTTGFVALDVVRALEGGPTQFAAGGSCGNVSANLAELGLDVTPLALLGADEEGRTVFEDLAASGVRTRYIEQRPDVRTPVVIHEILEPYVFGRDHRFVLNAPATGEPLPRYISIGMAEVDRFVRSGLAFRVLYVDRLSQAVLELVRWAKAAGAVTVFEPSEIGDRSLFLDALPLVDVIKISAERLSPEDETIQALVNPVQVITRGSDGLTLRTKPASGRPVRIDLPAEIPGQIVDTAGAGDAVSTALIRAIVAHPVARTLPPSEELVRGLRAGQRLAALNCSFVGARGAFRALPASDLLAKMAETASRGGSISDALPTAVRSEPVRTRSALQARYR